MKPTFSARLIIKLTGPEGTERVFMARDAEFVLRPQVGEQLQVGKGRYKVSNFFHNLDSGGIDVWLIQEWLSDQEAILRLRQKMEEAGWGVLSG